MNDESTISLSTLTQLAETMGGELGKKLLDFTSGMSSAGNSLLNFGEISKRVGPDATSALKSAYESSQKLVGSFGAFADEANKFTNSVKSFFNETVTAVQNLNLSGTDMVIAIEPVLGVINSSITGMGKLGDTGVETGSKLTTAFGAVEPLLTKVFGNDSATTRLSKAMVEGASHAMSLERELINMHIAQGQVGKVVDSNNQSFKNMNSEYVQFVAMSKSAAEQSGQTVASMMELHKALASIPGSLDSEQQAVQVSRLAVASGREQLEVAKQLAAMYTNLGTSEKDAVEGLAYIHDKAGDSKLRLETFNKTVMDVAGNFKMLGDNTVATTNFVSAFDKAFADSKIGPEAMREVITGIGEGISRMDVAKKAFVSSATGGPGGLAGAAQMDYAIQEGKADEVIRKTMQAMQAQFGGQIVTLKDAAQNPSLAGEFYKQIQYLTQVAGVAKDEDQAKRILEAMKSGAVDFLKPGAGAEEKGGALDRQLSMGNSLQEQSRTKLMEIHQTLEAARLRQDDIYHALMVQNPLINSRVENVLGQAMPETTIRHQNREATGHFGVTGNEPGRREQVKWENIIDLPSINKLVDFSGIKDKLEKSGDVSRFLESHAGKKTIESPTPVSAVETRTAEAPIIRTPKIPPGTDATHVVPEHKPSLGIPELPKVTLPTQKTEEIATKELVPMNFTHSFKPIRIDISGIGDKPITRIIQAEIESSERDRVAQGGLGTR